MSREEFLSLEPAYVFELREAWQDRERRSDLRTGVLAAIIANIFRDSDKSGKPYGPEDFFPSLASEPEEEPGPEDLAAKVLMAFGHDPSTVL